MNRIVTVLLALFLLIPVAHSSDPQAPSKSKYLATTAGGFIMRVGDAGAQYGLTFELRKKIKDPIFATVTFDNPGNPESPMVVEAQIAPGQKSFTTTSPSFTVAENGRTYFVNVALYSDVSRSKILGEHRQGLLFYVDEQLAPRVGISLK